MKTKYSFKELVEASKAPDSPVTEDAVERARLELQEGETDGQWFDVVYETWQEALAQIGFMDAKISFSGFWSQGDGASFTARVNAGSLIAFLSAPPEASECIGVKPGGNTEDFLPWVVHKTKGVRSNQKFNDLLTVADCLSCVVGRNDCRYSHEMTCSVESEFNDDGREDDHPDYEWTGHKERMRALASEFFEDVELLRKALCRAIYKDLEMEHEWLTSDEALMDTDYQFDEDGQAVEDEQ